MRGFIEIILGILLLFSKTRKEAALLIILMRIAFSLSIFIGLKSTFLAWEYKDYTNYCMNKTNISIFIDVLGSILTGEF